MKKILGVICCLLLFCVCTFIPKAQAGVALHWYDTAQKVDWVFYSGGNEATIYGIVDANLNNRYSLDIPSRVKYLDEKWIPVTGLCYNSTYYTYTFRNMKNLRTITIPNTVKEIQRQTFADCPSLVTVDMSTSLETIGASAFTRCPKLNNVILPSSLEAIGDSAFADCPSLATVDMPYYLKTIGASAFARCPKLTSVDLYNCPQLTSIGDNAFLNTALADDPFDLTATSITSIGASAFAGTPITEVELPSSIRTIGSNAFKGHQVALTYHGTIPQWAELSVGTNDFVVYCTEGWGEGYVENTTYSSVTPTNAVIKAVYSAKGSGNWTKSGVRLYDAGGNLIASKEENHNYNMKQLSVWYNINNELGKTLSPNTTYFFEIYTYFNGEVCTTSRTSFKT